MMKKIPYPAASSVVKRTKLSDDAMDLIELQDTPQAAMTVLEEAGLNVDLTHFLAHALPMREAIWWTALALKARHEDWQPKEQKLIDDCMRWVMEPNEALRRQIESEIKSLANDRAPRWLGQAVFWSGTGSIAPLGNPIVMPAEFLYAKAVAGAINTAAVVPEWKGNKTFYRNVFRMARDLAEGGNGSANGEPM
ncbi:hypothetical protein U5315_002510 [Vibrio fluvialis]|nr:hypothetical protein [Vibrio fluvialis]